MSSKATASQIFPSTSITSPSASPSHSKPFNSPSPAAVKDAFHFSPIDLLHAFQSAISFGKRGLSKSNPRQRSRENNEIGNADTLRFEHIELAQFSQIELDLDPNQTGAGHSFVTAELQTPTWCDLCGEFIWGVCKSTDNQMCQNCNYTCHQQCSNLVKLNCKTSQSSDTENEIVELSSESPDSPLLLEWPSGPELKKKIVIYNSTAQGFEMELQEDGETFHGFIRVHMNLTRPINVLAGTRPPSIYDIIYEEDDSSEKTLTSFYLPRDTVKAVHITSETTTQELISALLQKFKVVDNPRKFCLYEKYWDWQGSVKGVLRRMQDDERPLWLALTWGVEEIKNRKLVLQENDTGDIVWDAFSLPELNNFLKILDREEEEYLNQVRQNYKKMEGRLKDMLENYGMNRLPDEDPFTNM